MFAGLRASFCFPFLAGGTLGGGGSGYGGGGDGDGDGDDDDGDGDVGMPLQAGRKPSAEFYNPVRNATGVFRKTSFEKHQLHFAHGCNRYHLSSCHSQTVKGGLTPV